MESTPIVVERVLNADIDKVWQAISDKDKMKNWYFDIPDFEPVAGAEFQFEGGSEAKKYLHLCKIIDLVPGKKISYTWKYEDYPGESLVTFELLQDGNKTIIRLTHAGLETFPQDNPDFAKESFMGGWHEIIGKNLPQYVEKS
jgi:uncharacterized protein YndB with AHSA1/START domain